MATQASAQLMLDISCLTAQYVAKKYLEEQGFTVDVHQLKTDIREKFDVMVTEAGVAQSVMGRARTIDDAINGRCNSAYRNQKYMTTINTIKKLEQDLYNLRLLMDSMDIRKDVRVLSSLFRIRNSMKSGSVIEVDSSVYDKLEKGELISVDAVEKDKEQLIRLNQLLDAKNDTIKKLRHEIMILRATRLTEPDGIAINAKYKSAKRECDVSVVIELENKISYLEKLIHGLAKRCGFNVAYE
nr:MAG: NSP3 protein [Pachyptila rotavirus D]